MYVAVRKGTKDDDSSSMCDFDDMKTMLGEVYNILIETRVNSREKFNIICNEVVFMPNYRWEVIHVDKDENAIYWGQTLGNCH